MSRTALTGLFGLLMLAGESSAQSERPTKLVPVRPLTARELNRREALRHYALGLLQEKDSRLVEAVRSLEAARRLDPDVAAVHRALAPIYLALDRVEDALAACDKALRLNPDDHETSYLQARQFRRLDRIPEARAALRRTARCKGLKNRPDLLAQVHFDLGILAERSKDLVEAERAYRDLAKVLEQPDRLVDLGAGSREEIIARAAENHERLGRIYVEVGLPGKAVKAYEQARKTDPARTARMSLHIARIHQAQGKKAEALRALDDYLRTLPPGIEGHELRGKLLRELDRTSEVLPGLERAVARDPNNQDLQLLLARECRTAGQVKKAEKIYDLQLQRNVGPAVYRGLFELYRDLGPAGGDRMLDRLNGSIRKATAGGMIVRNADTASANAMLSVLRSDPAMVRLLLKAAAARLRTPPPEKDERTLVYGTRRLLAVLAARTRELALAEDLLRGCLGGPRETEAEVYAGLLEILQLRYKYTDIVTLCQRGLRDAVATNRVMFHRALALAQLRLGRDKQALAAAEDAVHDAGAKENLSARRTRVQILSHTGKHKEALAECRTLLDQYKMGAELREVRMLYSSVLLEAGKPDESEKQLQLVLDADSSDATACNNLGYQWADRNKNLAEAEKLIRKAIDLDRRARFTGPDLDAESDNASYVDSLGWVLFRQGKVKEARRELERASRMPDGANDPVVWDHLGDVYFRLSLRDRAGKAWRKALGLYNEGGLRDKRDPRYSEILEKLGLVRR